MDLNIVKIIIPPKPSYRFNEIFIEISILFFIEMDKNNSEIHMEPQRTLNKQNNLEKKNKALFLIFLGHHTF